MERLQIAIEKARKNRSRAMEGKAAPDPETPPPDSGAGIGTAPDPAPEPVASGVAADWLALKPLDLKPKVLHRRRVVTLTPGREAMSFDLLRTRLQQQAAKEGWRRLAIIAPHSGAGKTTLVANLAFSLGRQKDQRILALDFDLRRPGLATVLGAAPRHSMADVLRRKVGFADHGLRHGDNLAFGLNRSATRSAAELLQSRETLQVLTGIEELYRPDLVLFDMPPMLVTDDALGFLGNVDAAVIVAAAEQTPIRQIEAVEAQVAELTRVLGVVLNRCRFVGKDLGDYDY